MAEGVPELSKAEWVVMKQVWRLRRTNIREVHEELAGEQEWAYSTVRTMMERLREKGYLSAKKVGNTFIYEPTLTRQSTTRRVLRSFADKVFDGAIGPIVAHLIREEKLTPEERREIRELLDKETGKLDEKG